MFRFSTFAISLLLILGINMVGLAEITDDMIVAAWLFDGDANDISKNGYNGELQGGKFVAGQFGQALELNGSSEWVAINQKMGSFEELTFAHWLNCTGRDGQWRTFFNNNAWKPGDIHYQLHTDSRVEFSIHSNPGGNDKFATYKVTGGELNKWIHIVTAYSAKEGKIWFYINGKLNAEHDWGNNPAVLDVGQIGAWKNNAGNQERHMQGLFDEFVIFNTVLTEDDINALMDGGLEGGLAVDPKGKLAVTWGSLKK